MQPVLVAGTNSWMDDGRCDWYCPGHPFALFLESHGCAPMFNGPRPFVWTTDLAGIPFFTNRKEWSAGGAALAYFVMAMNRAPKAETAVIAHSHGLQVAAYAAAEYDLKIHTLVTVGSPIRKDMAKQYKALRLNTRYWLHVHSDCSDRWQWLGEMFDGHFGIVRDCVLADRNAYVRGVGHSELLRDPVQYHYWLKAGWLDQLKG